MSASQPIAIQTGAPPDEEARLVLAAQGNPVQFQALYDRWAAPVYHYFYYRTGDLPSAEDLTSQLFLAAYQSLPRYRHRGHFAAWLFTIARNLSREYYRKTRREAPLEFAERLVALSDPGAEAAQADEIRRLVRLVRALPDDQQELIRLRYVAELSFADMALVLNKREDAVKKSLYRLQARLQSLLEQNDA
jgi:RNA polymerase sigma-70 factor, ECF subfamily